MSVNIRVNCFNPADTKGQFSIYNKIGKTYLFDIDFYYLKSRENPDDEEWGNKYVVDAYHAGNV